MDGKMWARLTNRKGSLTIEYAILVAIVVVALLGMQGYIRRAICGRWRASADTFGHGRQYDPTE